MKGTVQANGILGDDGKLYDLDFRVSKRHLHEPEVLFIMSSWARVPLSKYIGKRVHFQIAPSGKGYNYGVLNKDETAIIKL